MPIYAFIESLSKGTYLDLIEQGLRHIHFSELIPNNARIFIKPNLTFPTYRPGVMTSPDAVEAAILAVQKYSPNIFIGDSDSGGYNRFSMDEVYEKTGIWKFAEQHRVQVVNLSKLERKAMTFGYRDQEYTIHLPTLLTDEIDLLITMPVPKIHANTGVSLTFKNQWGCIPEPGERLRLHPHLKHVILEVNKAVKTRVVIMDGKYGLNVNGPLRGVPVELDWVLVTNHIGAGAQLACHLMQVPLEKIEHLKYAKDSGWIPSLSEIETNQDIRLFIKEKFYLKRKWTDYPGLLAFRFSALAYLAYFSRLSGLLHRILYWFREPFYEYRK